MLDHALNKSKSIKQQKATYFMCSFQRINLVCALMWLLIECFCISLLMLSNITRSRHVSTIYVAIMSIKMVPSNDSNIDSRNITSIY